MSEQHDELVALLKEGQKFLATTLALVERKDYEPACLSMSVALRQNLDVAAGVLVQLSIDNE